MQNNSKLWWPICVSESVPTDKPIGIQLENIELAIYRDAEQHIRAVEDRCPHRRAPLSLGRITPQGHIQCGYHGWTFDGETGDISGFPNLDEGERLPRCSITTYTTLEKNGVVYLGFDEQDKTLLSVTEKLETQAEAILNTGKVIQGLSHTEAVAAFLDNPNYFLNIMGIEFVDKILANPKVEDGLLICERAGRWNVIGESRFYLGPLRHRADFSLRLLSYTTPITGETLVKVYAGEERLLAELLITFTPSTRAMTSIHWRAKVYPQTWGWLKPLLQSVNLLKRPIAGISKHIDYSALALEPPTASTVWRTLPESTPA